MPYFCKNTDLKGPLLTYCFFLFLAFSVSAQDSTYPLSNQAFYQFISSSRFEGCRFSNYNQITVRFIDFKNTNWKNYVQQVINLNNRLYIHLLGSGLVYGSALDENGQIFMKRLDHTEHFGYNINSFTFTANQKLYNIGGYGLWRWNGQLRLFQEKTQQWELEPLNEERVISPENPGVPVWVSPDKSRLVSLGYLTGNEAIKGTGNQSVNLVPELIQLDLKKFDWTEMGRLNPSYSKMFKQEQLLLHLDDGMLFSNYGPVYLLDLHRFVIRELINRDFQNLLFKKIQRSVNWSKGNTIYFAHPDKVAIDSLVLNTAYFRDTDQSIFADSPIEKLIGLSVATLLLIGGVFWMSYRKRKIKLAPSESGPQEMKPDNTLISPYPDNGIFEAVEKALLILLIENARERGQRTGTDEVNRVLGVAQKSLDMQKRKRSDVIRAINGKYKLIRPQVNQPLIDRVKSDVDARLFEYFLLHDEIENLLQYVSPAAD
jgi:hypothetical protein